MKKTIITLIALVTVVAGYSQKSKAFDAESYFNDYNSHKDKESLNKAKECIDLASEHPDTKENPYVLITKGKIYMALYEEAKKSTDASFAAIIDEQKHALKVYENTPTTDLSVAYQAYSKAKKLDLKNKYSDEYKVIDYIGMSFDYTGRAKFNEQRYADALTEFEQAYEISNFKDTTVLYLCAVSADYSGNHIKAKEYYSKMIETKQAKANNYISLSNTFYALKDTVGATETLKKGRTAFPQNINIITLLVNHYLKINKGEEVLNDLNSAISENNDINLFLLRGNVYDNIALNLKDNKDSLKRYNASIASAEKDYMKALAIDSTNFYGLFNLGILYFNKGVLLNNTANDVTDIKKFNALNEQANIEFNKALPLLETASKQQPNDTNTLLALKQLYTRLKIEDKLKIVNDKLKQ